MLARFRQQKVHTLSTHLIIFAILVKMMMPIAHAGTALSGKATGIFSALCTANGLVYLDAETGEYVKDKAQTKHDISTSNKCPLCFIVEQSTLNNTPKQLATAPNLNPALFATTHNHIPPNHQCEHFHIRAPPQLS